MKVDIAARTDVGLVRTQNEDAYGLWTLPADRSDDITRAIITVADGMGGHPGGDVASSVAVDTAREIVQASPEVPPLPLLQEVFREASLRIRSRGDEEPVYREMGTTLTAVYISGGRVWLGHIGDTRLYWIRGSRWLQVTRDHTVAQELVNSGKLDAETADDHPMSNVLTRCLGICPEDHPDLLEGPLSLEAGDLLLLASDGLAKTVHSDALVDLIGGVEVQKATSQLIEASLAGGAPDNVTVVLLRILSAEPPAPEENAVGFGVSDFVWLRA